MSSMEKSAPPPGNGRLVAVIDVGASAIRIEVAELRADGGVRVVDEARQPVELGRDTFSTGRIGRPALHQCIEALRGYRHLMEEYGITQSEHIRVVATSAVREASNRDTFLDQVYGATGLEIHVIDEAEEIRLTYLAAQGILESEPSLAEMETLAVDAGGGSTEVLLLQSGRVAYSASFRISSLRLRQSMSTVQGDAPKAAAILRQEAARFAEQLHDAIPDAAPAALIAISNDAALVARHLIPDWDRRAVWEIPTRDFTAFASKVAALDVDRVVRKYRVSFAEAEALGPALALYARLAKVFNINRIVLPRAELREGILREMALPDARRDAYARQVIRSATNLANKYQADEAHARQVAQNALQLFDALTHEHRLGPWQRLLLETAARLHDIGYFVNSRSHHKHTHYLILNSDLFGLTTEDMRRVALIARYHRRALPSLRHPEFAALDRVNRIEVSKLAALLRIADALDRNHLQNNRVVSVVQEQGRLNIHVAGVDDLTIERLAMQEKADLFEEVFGMPACLRAAPPGGEEVPHG